MVRLYAWIGFLVVFHRFPSFGDIFILSAPKLRQDAPRWLTTTIARAYNERGFMRRFTSQRVPLFKYVLFPGKGYQ